MNKRTSFRAFLASCLGVLLSMPTVFAATTADPAATQLHAELAQVGVDTFTASSYKPGVVRHVVLLRFRDDLDGASRQKIIAQFLALQQTSVRGGKPYITSIETGPQISGEGASHGLEQAFLLTFASQGDRNYFIGTPVVTEKAHYEPVHEAFKAVLKPALAKGGLVSFDYPVSATSP